MSQTQPQQLLFYSSPVHDCNYLPGREARTVFADPKAEKSPRLYGLLARHGFRRSGGQIYRPNCDSCQACVPIRVRAEEFKASRRHRRSKRRNADLRVQACAATYSDERFELYQRYLNVRHRAGGMDETSPAQFEGFLIADWAATQFVEFRQEKKLLAVAVLDLFEDGLSAVYTFFDPLELARGIGTYAVLWALDEVIARRLEYLYLGYLIDDCPKMAYKAEFKPQQQLPDGAWILA